MRRNKVEYWEANASSLNIEQKVQQLEKEGNEIISVCCTNFLMMHDPGKRRFCYKGIIVYKPLVPEAQQL
jgi:hypothetical protein